MDQYTLLVLLRARTGKEVVLESFLISTRPLVLRDIGTTQLYAVSLDSTRFAIFDTFAGDCASNSYLNDEVASLLFANAEELFAKSPVVERFDILTARVPAAGTSNA